MDICKLGKCEECNMYEDNVKRVCEEAIDFIKRRPFEKISTEEKAPLIIFDIDGTALDDRRKSKNPDGTMMKHQHVHTFYQECVKLGYEIVFLTGRLYDGGRARQNLDNEGYLPQHDIIFCPGDIIRTVYYIGIWKDKVRCDLKQRYHLVACIGDQSMDVEGLHVGERQFKLPEPPQHQQGCCVQ